MRLKNSIVSAFALTLGLCGVAFAATDYFPPERINCKLNEVAQLSCEGFDRQYLSEDTYTVDFPPAKEMTLFFVKAVAYFDLRTNEASVFYTYNNSAHRMVKLKTINTQMRPDLTFQAWTKFMDNIYNCEAGYMQCPITNLPTHSRS
jgi:hypothetical protein